MNFVRFANIVSCVAIAATASAQLTWTTNSPIPSGKRQMGVAAFSNYIYVIGGRTGTNNSGNEVYLGTVANGGTITWSTLTATPGQVTTAGTAVYNNKLYVFGGWDENFVTKNVCYYATINPVDGTIGSWTTSAVTIPDQGGASYSDSFGSENMVFNGKLYVINGENNGGIFTDAALYSAITGTGDYGAWTSTNEPTDAASWMHNLGFFQGATASYIYKIGGTAGLFSASPTTVQGATINANGTLGTWAQQTNGIPSGRSEGGLGFFGNRFYLMGGVDPVAPGIAGSTTVFVGTANATTGQITWATDASSLPAARCRNRGTAFKSPNGTVYIACIGGRLSDSDPAEATVFTAQIVTAGVSDWTMY